MPLPAGGFVTPDFDGLHFVLMPTGTVLLQSPDNKDTVPACVSASIAVGKPK